MKEDAPPMAGLRSCPAVFGRTQAGTERSISGRVPLTFLI